MLNFQTHSWCELWITLIIQQAEYQTNQGPQWDLCLNFFNKNIFSFCTCRFPHQYHFPRQITVCKILYWKGLLCPQWALAKNTFPVFSPPQEHPYRLSTLRIKSRIQYYATKKSTTENHPWKQHPISALKQCPLLSFKNPPEIQEQRTPEHTWGKRMYVVAMSPRLKFCFCCFLAVWPYPSY